MADTKSSPASDAAAPVYGMAVQFVEPGDLIDACEKVRDAGYSRWDAHTPFPVHGLDAAMGIRGTRLPWLVLCGGLTGLGLALLMQWWMNAVDYPFMISGKPFFGLPAVVPVAFELTGSFGRLRDALARATSDRFLVVIEAADPRFDAAGTLEFMESLGGSPVEILEDR